MAEISIFFMRFPNIFLISAMFSGVIYGIYKVINKKFFPIGRLKFFIFFSVYAIIISFVDNSFWTIAEKDIDKAAIFEIFGIIFSSFIITYAAMSRSLDAYGETGYAFMVFVPIISLFLFLKKPIDRTRLNNRTNFQSFKRILILLICCFLSSLLIALPRLLFFQNREEKFLGLDNLSLERALNVQSSFLNLNVPYKIDTNIEFIGSIVYEKNLIMNYHIYNNSLYINRNGIDLETPRKMFCFEKNFEKLIKRGSNIQIRYYIFFEKRFLELSLLNINTNTCDIKNNL